MTKILQERFLFDGEYRTENGIICGGVVSKLYEVREKTNHFLNIYVLERPLTFNKIGNVRDDKSTKINEATCIPVGEYKVVLEHSNRFGRELFEIKGVPNRTETKYHVGNHVDCSEGCPLVGKIFFQKMRDNKTKNIYNLWLARSKEAEDEMKKILPREFDLIIRNA